MKIQFRVHSPKFDRVVTGTITLRGEVVPAVGWRVQLPGLGTFRVWDVEATYTTPHHEQVVLELKYAGTTKPAGYDEHEVLEFFQRYLASLPAEVPGQLSALTEVRLGGWCECPVCAPSPDEGYEDACSG